MIRSAVALRGDKGITGTISADAGDLRLQAVIGNATVGGFTSSVDIDGLSVSLEKPGSFIFDYDIPNKDVQFQFMNTMCIADKQLNWTYSHSRNHNRTCLDGTLAIDSCNKISASHELGTRSSKLRYSHIHRGVTKLEPGYDFAKNSWDFAVSHVFDDDVIKASYDTSTKYLGIEWSCRPALRKEGRVKITALFNLADGLTVPKLFAESVWNFDL